MFGDAKVNIADMVISREIQKDGTSHALMLIKTDSVPTDALIEGLKARPGIVRVKHVELPRRSTAQ
jgi:hypothetical protein